MAVTGAMTFIVGRIAGTDISLGLVTAGVMGVWPLAMFFGGVAALASGVLHSRAGGDWAGGWAACRDVFARRRRPARQRLGSDPLDIGIPLLRRTNA